MNSSIVARGSIGRISICLVSMASPRRANCTRLSQDPHNRDHACRPLTLLPRAGGGQTSEVRLSALVLIPLCPNSALLTTLGRDTTPAQVRSFRLPNSYSCYRASVRFSTQRRSAGQHMGNCHAARRLSLTFAWTQRRGHIQPSADTMSPAAVMLGRLIDREASSSCAKPSTTKLRTRPVQP